MKCVITHQDTKHNFAKQDGFRNPLIEILTFQELKGLTDIFSFRWKVCAKLIKLVCQLRCPIKKVFFNFGYVQLSAYVCKSANISLSLSLDWKSWIFILVSRAIYKSYRISCTFSKKNHTFTICLKNCKKRALLMYT